MGQSTNNNNDIKRNREQVPLTAVAHADGALQLEVRRVALQLAILYHEEHFPVIVHVQAVEEVADGRADDGGAVRGPHHLVVAVHGAAAALVTFRVAGLLLQADEALIIAATCAGKVTLHNYDTFSLIRRIVYYY